MDFEIGRQYHGFRLTEQKEIKELKAMARLFQHDGSGARLYHLENDDDNKVFSITFKTPPPNSTGLPHILEHAVLCGSRKFPTKEPFVELAKGSLNTFLNAMTFADKTMYPIASKNDKDFLNLMDVYLDAVFHPNIYEQPETLMQEGWHYELDAADAPLRYKGVVFNEMKGAFSSPEQVLFRKIQESLYPDTPYGVDSGGDPEVIPELTQEQFLAFHQKYYHPANSFIYLYGNGNILEHLEFLNEGYLKDFNAIAVDAEIPVKEPFTARRDVPVEYSVSPDENTAEKSYLSLNFSVGRSTDPVLYLAFHILEYLLLDNPAAPLKKALLEAGIGKDVFGVYDNSIHQPTFSIVSKNAEAHQKEDFIRIIEDTLKNLVVNGIDKRLVEAAINIREFKLREADYGGRPRGLVYGIRCMDSWLYGADPALHLSFEGPLARIKDALTTPFFEGLIDQYLLQNTHSSLLVVAPKPGLAEARDKEINDKLQAYKATLPPDEIQRILRCTQELKEKQAAPDSPEALATIPMVSLEDIEEQAEVSALNERFLEGIKTLHHPAFTNGIAYLSLYFDTMAVPQELLPYAGLLTGVLGEISTGKHHYEELSKEINIHTGGIDYTNQAFALNGKDGEYIPKFVIKGKALVTKLPKLVSLLQELVTETIYDDPKRLKEIIQEARSRLEMGMYQQGHLMAINRLSSYFSPAGRHSELLSGISFYKFLSGLERDFEAKKQELIQNLQQVSDCIFQKNRLLVGITLSDEDYPDFETVLTPFIGSLSDAALDDKVYAFSPSPDNEGLMTPGKVQYVAKGYSFIKMGYEYTGALQVLRTIASLDYLWNRLRVQGGAYGAMAHFTRSGGMLFASYRDPNLTETLTIYEQLADYLSSFDTSQREMTKYIIGTISRMDTPLTPPMQGDRAVGNYLSGITPEAVQKERDEILQTSSKTIQALAPMVGDVMKNRYHCVLGNEGKIKENKDLFGSLIPVFE